MERYTVTVSWYEDEKGDDEDEEKEVGEECFDE